MDSFKIKTKDNNFFDALKPLIPKAIEISHLCFEQVLINNGRIIEGEYDKEKGLEGLFVQDFKIWDSTYGFTFEGVAFSSTPEVEQLGEILLEIEKLLTNLHIFNPKPFPDENLRANITISHLPFPPGSFTVKISARRYRGGMYGGDITVLYDTFINNINELISNLEHSKIIKSNTFRELYEDMKNAKNNIDKKNTLENFIITIFSSIDGFEVKYHDKRGIDSEIDIFIINESNDTFFKELGTPIIIECKNWNKPIPAKEIRDFGNKLRDKRVETGIIVTLKGITGKDYQDAKASIRTISTRDKINIIVINDDDLRYIISGIFIKDILRTKFYELRTF